MQHMANVGTGAGRVGGAGAAVTVAGVSHVYSGRDGQVPALRTST
jgi:hypothetical protein